MTAHDRLYELAQRVTCSEVHEGVLCVDCRREGHGCLRAWALAREIPDVASPSPRWLPIEIAPKDSEILSWDGKHTRVVMWVKFSDGTACWCYPQDLSYRPNPTHWMSLPAPPKDTP